MYEVSLHFEILGDVINQNQAGAGLAPLGIFCGSPSYPVISTPLAGAVLPESDLEKMSQPRVRICRDIKLYYAKRPRVPVT